MMGVHFIYDADTFSMTDAGVVNVFVAGNINDKTSMSQTGTPLNLNNTD